MNQQQLQSDLSYVRDVVQRSDRVKSPHSIYYFWAVVSLVGFAIVDYAPQQAGLFWAIAGPGGWLLSALLGRAHARKTGALNRRLGLRYGAHWAGLLGAIFLLMFGVAQGAWSVDSAAHLILLVLALTYFLAGLHLDRALMWVSLILAGGYLALFYVTGPVWTITGIAVAIGLVLTPWLEGREDARQ